MSKTFKDRVVLRRGAPTNLRNGGVMTTANRKRDARRDRHTVKLALRRGEEV